MGKLFHHMAWLWTEFRKRRLYATEISPGTIRRLADELGHLAELTAYSVPLSAAEACHIQALRQEMRSLADMTDKPEFCRLSVERRLALHESLQRSQEKLLSSIQTVHSSTERMQ